VVCLATREFTTCCNVVSRENSQAEELTPCRDERLQQSLDLLVATLPAGFSWPHREGLGQALQYGARKWLTNTRVDMTRHLADRMRRWIVARLGSVVEQRGMEKHLWTIADHIVSSLIWHERKAAAQARAANKPHCYGPSGGLTMWSS
jgi:hypothetical protein